MDYQNNGNISQKSDIGFYDYGSSRPHAVTEVYNLSGSSVSSITHNIEYNAAQQPEKVTLHNSFGDFSGLYFLTYGPDDQRRTSVYDIGVKSYGKVYSGLYEKHQDGTQLNYIQTPDGLCGVYVTGNTTVADGMYYLNNDHLGSLVAVSEQSGSILNTYGYDPWGRRRDAWNLTDYNVSDEPLFTRGFTGHEHIAELGLINMNGRMYDPRLARMLSPDNFVQMPDFSQNFNRYAYCFNNPLMYTDPDGEWVHIVVGAVIGGAINLTVKAIQGDINSWGDGFAAFGIGAVAGAVGAATGGAAFLAAGGAAGGAGGFLAGFAGGAVGSAFGSPIQAIGNTAYFGDPMMTGKQYLTGIAIGGVLGGTINGGIAAANGKTFWNGTVKPSNISTPTTTPTLQFDEPEVKLNTDGMRSQIKELPPARGEIKEFHARQLYLKELEQPHMYSQDHIKNGLNEALSSSRLDGYDKVAKLVIDADRAGQLVRGSNQIRFVSNGYATEVRLFIDNNGVIRSLDAFVLTGDAARYINNVVIW
jgi:RHS repeat-associated protein